MRALLDAERDRKGDERFTARNFLLDENVTSERATEYEKALPAPTADTWNKDHETYLEQAACWNASPFPPRRVDPRDSGTPSTFRTSLGDMGMISKTTWLVRVTHARRLARDAGLSLDTITRALTQPDALDRVLKLAAQRAGQPPVFAALWEDVADLLPVDPTSAAPDWADRLRDRLGLPHLRPLGRRGTEILIFRYPASRVPPGATSTVRPFTIPTVLDMSRFPAFCPVPRDSDFGRVVDLVPNSDRPRREMLHPPVRLRQEDLFRRGTLLRQPPALDRARGAHIDHLRAEYTRPDYGDATDAELIT